MKKAVIFTSLLAALTAIVAPVAGLRARASNVTVEPPQTSQCPIIIVSPVAVAPNQPGVPAGSTRGIINALCDVTLNLVNCGFLPTSITLTCDTNGDGVPELSIPLKNITAVNRNLVRATLGRLSPQLPGTPFPITCCGGSATLILRRTVSAGDDNVFGGFTQTATCPIDLGLRAPVVISATPSDGDCAVQQNLLISGSCFVQPNGTPNVTTVSAVERGNPNNVIQASNVVVLNPNLIDALFNFGPSSAGKTFLIFASGPNGTSRNLTALPAGVQTDCPLGNEQGVQISFTCKASGGPSPGGGPPPPPILRCRLERSSTGAFSLILEGQIIGGSTITLGGVAPKKVQFKDPIGTNLFGRVILKGRLCGALPGAVVVTSPNGTSSAPFQCAESCQSQ